MKEAALATGRLTRLMMVKDQVAHFVNEAIDALDLSAFY